MYEKLIKLLFFNKQTQKLLCNDLFQEFGSIIPIEYCICKKNTNSKTRELNYLKVKNIIEKFLILNRVYLNKLFELFNFKTINEILEHLIICYLFYISKTNKNFKTINVFKSKYSIGYNKYDYLLAV